MGVNKKFKDTVFSFLFNDPIKLRELYCAIENVTLPSDVPIVINTLKNVLHINRFNDLSFEIGGKIVVLIEHQSTINPNMALRLLLYITMIYEKNIQGKNIYANKQILLPEPEFIVLYNGETPYPDEAVLKLSDVFENRAALGLPCKKAALELEARVININEGRNEELARKCGTLAQYGALIGKVRDFQKKNMTLEKAVKKAVEYCIKHDILKEFLEKHATEVMKMLRTEWKLKDALAVRYEEGVEDGFEKGYEKSRNELARNALMKGLSINVIHEITGLDADTIENLQKGSS
ncbi:MAG: Rpn family recombination-promoting nuclease/putative transposase [Treponema sp.]|jgi:predicted transposase YdaD|nr:Rpn family recombination-promoting nuclease/putative transposase [Treponema sp.]